MLVYYGVIGLMFLSAVLMGSMLLGLGQLVRQRKPTPAKLEPYESGVPQVSPPRGRYNPRFYVVAILFVVFDIEAIFLFPWAVAFNFLGVYGYVEAVIFVSLLLIGLLYEWKKGALEWV